MVPLLCCALSYPAFLHLHPASSTLLAQLRQHHLCNLSGPATEKGRGCRQPLLADGAPSCSAEQPSTECPQKYCWRREVCAPRNYGVWSQCFCIIHCGIKSPEEQVLVMQGQIKLGAGRCLKQSGTCHLVLS